MIPADGGRTGSAGGTDERAESGRPAGGVRFRPASLLATRALEALARGPVTSETLVRSVLGLRNVTPELATRLAAGLLEREGDVTLDGASRWRFDGTEGWPRGRLGDLDYVVVDVETTGGSAGKGHRVTEFAAVQVSGGRVVGEFATLVRPGRPIPPWVSGLTGITDAMVADAPAFPEVADRVREVVEGRIFVAHNAAFDWRFLEAEMRRARSLVPVGPRLCTLRLARRALPDLRARGLDALTEHYGIEVEGRHRALGDALATVAVLRQLLEEAGRRGVTDGPGLDRWLAGGRPVDVRARGRRGVAVGPEAGTKAENEGRDTGGER